MAKERVYPQSLAIRMMAYDDVHHELEIAWYSGGRYRLTLVPVDVWQQLKAASSAGWFYTRKMSGVYPIERIA